MSVQKKGDNYFAVVMYRDELGKKKYKWVNAGPSIREAEKLERRIRADLERGEISFAEKMTLKKYLDKWLETAIKPIRRSSTYDNYKSTVNNITKNLGSLILEKLKPMQIQEHFNKELARGLKPTSVRLQYSILNEAMEKAIQWQLIPKNPCIGTEPPSKNKPNSAAFTPQQSQLLLDAAQRTPLYLGIALGVLCGLRRGEICGLRWQDIHGNSAKIQHSLDRMNVDEAKKIESNKNYAVFWSAQHKEDSKTVLVLGPVKTEESEADIPLPEIVTNELKVTQLSQKLHKQQMGEAYQDNDLVFCWESGIPYDPDYFYKAYKKMIKSYNQQIDADDKIKPEGKESLKLPVLRLHDLRHTHATLLLRNKVDTKVVSRQLRHKRSSFTADVYQHVTKDIQSETANVMDDMFGKKQKNEGLENGLEETKKA
jgi:integrase